MKQRLFFVGICLLIILLLLTACAGEQATPPATDQDSTAAASDGPSTTTDEATSPDIIPEPKENAADIPEDIPEPNSTAATPLPLPNSADYPDQESYEQALNDYFSARLGHTLTTEERNAAIEAEYSLVINGETTLTLGAPLDANLPADFPLIPSKEESDILGQSADTYRGTQITTYYFGNLYLQIWDAQQAASPAWLSFLEASAATCQGLSVVTPCGLTVGDSLDRLLQLYPDAQPVPLEGDYLVYKQWATLDSTPAGSRGLFFWIENNQVSKIQLVHGIDGAASPLIPYEGV